MTLRQKKAVGLALLAALLYAVHSPLSKLLLTDVSATMMASFLYLGAGLGLFFVGLIRRFCGGKTKEQSLTAKELPYTVAMILLDIAAPVFLMLGLSRTTAANASLLNNFEIVATSVIAWVIFGERSRCGCGWRSRW